MNRVWFYCEGEVVLSGVFEAVLALRGAPGADGSQCRFGLGAVAGGLYCQFHSNISYQPKGPK